MWTGFGGHPLTIPVDPRWYLPVVDFQANWAGEWAKWFLSNGKAATPPKETQQSSRPTAKPYATPDDAKRDALLKGVVSDCPGRVLHHRDGAGASGLLGPTGQLPQCPRDATGLLALSFSGTDAEQAVLIE